MFSSDVLCQILAARDFPDWQLLDPSGYLPEPARWIILALIAMFFAVAAISLERLFRLTLAVRSTRSLIRKTQPAFARGNLLEIEALAGDHRSSHLSAAIRFGVSAFRRQSASHQQFSGDLVQTEMRRAIRETTIKFRWGLNTLASIATTAPLVGLLGTVFGIRNAFRGIGMSHYAVISMIAGTLSDALITTALGMVVAILATWSYNFLSDLLGLLQIEMHLASSELLTFLAKQPAGRWS